MFSSARLALTQSSRNTLFSSPFAFARRAISTQINPITNQPIHTILQRPSNPDLFAVGRGLELCLEYYKHRKETWKNYHDSEPFEKYFKKVALWEAQCARNVAQAIISGLITINQSYIKKPLPPELMKAVQSTSAELVKHFKEMHKTNASGDYSEPNKILTTAAKDRGIENSDYFKKFIANQYKFAQEPVIEENKSSFTYK